MSPLGPYGQEQERVRLLWHMLEVRLSAGPLGPAAQYDCQQLAAVKLSLRLADLHCSLSRQLMVAVAWKLCAFGVVTLGGLSRGSSRRPRPEEEAPETSLRGGDHVDVSMNASRSSYPP